MILVDANIIMYACGADHPLKAPCVDLLRAIALQRVDAVTDAEVLQEILHRYRSIRRWEQGEIAYALARETFASAVLDISAATMDLAASLMGRHPRLMARDAVHLAVVELNGLDGICSYDRDFDQVPGVRRLEPGSILGN